MAAMVTVRAAVVVMSIAMMPVAPVISMVMVSMGITARVAVHVAIHGRTWRRHYHWWWAVTRSRMRHHDPRQRRKRDAEVDVEACLRSCGGSEENRREHYEFFHTRGWTEIVQAC